MQGRRSRSLPGPGRRRLRTARGSARADVACGAGRNSDFLAKEGFEVVAIDRSPEALRLAAGPGVETRELDLEAPGVDLGLGALIWSS
ncbi:MAG: class I SAM-dependent methyltransferase [Bryobacterales bacterium]